MKLTCLSTEQIGERLKAAGVQPTLQRISIAKYMLCEADHPTADEVFAWAEKNMATISQATIYNTLNTLVEAGLLKTFRFPHTEKVVFDGNIEEHFHFYDVKTERLMDLDFSQVKIDKKLGKNFEVQKTEVLFIGEYKK